MKKYICEKCGDWFLGTDEHFKSTANVCDNCGELNSYKQQNSISDNQTLLDKNKNL